MFTANFPTTHTPEILLMEVPETAAAHNTIYRGEDIGGMGIETICNNINDGTFRDLFIGDYFDVTITTSYTESEVVRCMLAGFDMYLKNGDTELKQHHAVVIPKNCFTATAKMNPTDVTTGGYVGSDMYKTVLPAYSTALQTALSNHILTYRDLLTTATVTEGESMAGAGWKGYASGWGWQSITLRLMSEVQVYGTKVFSSSFFDIGAANLQLPIFAMNPALKVAGNGGTDDDKNRVSWWLSAVASSSVFVDVSSLGNANRHAASIALGVRPLFLIGNPAS